MVGRGCLPPPATLACLACHPFYFCPPVCCLPPYPLPCHPLGLQEWSGGVEWSGVGSIHSCMAGLTCLTTCLTLPLPPTTEQRPGRAKDATAVGATPSDCVSLLVTVRRVVAAACGRSRAYLARLRTTSCRCHMAARYTWTRRRCVAWSRRCVPLRVACHVFITPIGIVRAAFRAFALLHSARSPSDLFPGALLPVWDGWTYRTPVARGRTKRRRRRAGTAAALL